MSLFLAGVLAMGSLAATAQTPAAATQNIAQLNATATVEVQQDWLSMSLSTTRDGTDAATVQAQLKAALEAALAEARKSVAPGQMDVRTGNFGLYPRYGRDGKISGWQGQAELVLEGRDIARISAVAGRIPTMTLGQVGFGLSREQRAKTETEAQAAAIEQFKGRALEITRGFGFSSYTLREVSVQSSGSGPSPRPRAMALEAKSAMADSPVPVEAGRAMVQVTVSGSIQMK